MNEILLFHILMADLTITIAGLLIIRRILLKMRKKLDDASLWANVFRKEYFMYSHRSISQPFCQKSGFAQTSTADSNQDQNA